MKIIHVVVVIICAVVGLLYSAFALSVGEGPVGATVVFVIPVAAGIVFIIVDTCAWSALRSRYRDWQLKRRDRDR